MTGYKLFYARAKGEVKIIQLIFAAAGKTYEDVKLNDDQVEAFARDYGIPVTAFPLLQFGEKKFLCFTEVISRSLAREFDLVGKDNRQHSTVDFICELVEHLAQLTGMHQATGNQRAKEDSMNKIHDILYLLEGVLKKLPGRGGYFYGDQLTVADLCYFLWYGYANTVMPDLWSKHPIMKSLAERVSEHENIAKWLATM